jgi:hypothetical protein
MTDGWFVIYDTQNGSRLVALEGIGTYLTIVKLDEFG